MRVRFVRFNAPETVRLPEIKPLPWTAKSLPGVVVPIPTLPFASMMNAVVVAEAVEVEIVKSGRLESVAVDVPTTERIAHGVVVPIPTFVAPAA